MASGIPITDVMICYKTLPAAEFKFLASKQLFTKKAESLEVILTFIRQFFLKQNYGKSNKMPIQREVQHSHCGDPVPHCVTDSQILVTFCHV